MSSRCIAALLLSIVIATGATSALAQAPLDDRSFPPPAAPFVSPPVSRGPVENPPSGYVPSTNKSAEADPARANDDTHPLLEPSRPLNREARPPVAEVKHGLPQLPEEHGQVWREYNLTPYTVRVTSTNRPEQAVVDWILRETGYEVWHGEPLGILSANSRTLRVYHTPEIQAIVHDVVDRFVNSEAESYAFGLRVVTVDSPNWRARVHPMLRPVAVQAQGVQAWLLAKEDAAVLLADLRKRGDFREHSSPHMLVNNGQSSSVSVVRPKQYIRDVIARPEVWPGFENQAAQFDEGFTLELSPLLSLDGRTVDAVIKCNIDQLEKLVPVMLDVPTANAPRQRTKIEVPQATHCRLHERFRWPADQLLVIDLGVVPPPMPTDANPLSGLPLVGSPSRSNLLVFVESKGRVAASPQPTATPGGVREAKTYRGRY
ncbi:MAG: hypothetical protein JSS27_06750 [Planctomycetes bacterium]|nr:hypothetical protein [Planctomycetota bacterium]